MGLLHMSEPPLQDPTAPQLRGTTAKVDADFDLTRWKADGDRWKGCGREVEKRDFEKSAFARRGQLVAIGIGIGDGTLLELFGRGFGWLAQRSSDKSNTR